MSKQNTFIIGATSTFGKATANELLNDGHDLLLTYFSKENELSDFKKIAKEKGSELIILQLDVTNELQVNKIIEESPIKINNVVYSVSAPIEFKTINEENWDDFEKQLNVQIKGLWQIIKKLISDAHPLQSVVVIGSACLFNVPPARLTSYTVGKYGLLGLVRSLANEFSSRKITVNMISPGVSGEGLSSVYPQKFLELVKSQTPLKRLVKVKDVAYLVKFLLSKEAEYLTGLNIPIDGGIHMT
ncbi:SDR family oxidoreductase [Patescibacteria group bacterium]|nr:SDR family oxidoreductase [Patescibacteria group bacterium]